MHLGQEIRIGDDLTPRTFSEIDLHHQLVEKNIKKIAIVTRSKNVGDERHVQYLHQHHLEHLQHTHWYIW